MFDKAVSKKKSGNIVPINTLVGDGSKFEGNIYVNGALKLDGEMVGDIISISDIIVGESAYITGNITCNNILVSGSVTGNISAVGQLSLSSTAMSKGELKAGSLIIDEGAEFTGNCQTLDKNS